MSFWRKLFRRSKPAVAPRPGVYVGISLVLEFRTDRPVPLELMKSLGDELYARSKTSVRQMLDDRLIPHVWRADPRVDQSDPPALVNQITCEAQAHVV